RVPRVPRIGEAGLPRLAAARAGAARLVVARHRGPPRRARAHAARSPSLSRDRHGGREGVSRPRLLAVNFRDPHHPEAGGAELHREEILLEAVRRGWDVTWLATGFRGGTPEEEYRGMHIVRRGDWYDFNLRLPGILKAEFSNPAPDLVVEDINKVP